MKFFLTVAVMLLASLAPALAQQEADEKYLDIYSLIQSAETLAGNGETRDALAGLTDAQTQLQKFQKLYPTWNPDIVAYRLNDIGSKMAAMKGQSVPKSVEKNPATPNDATVPLRNEVSNLSADLKRMQQENDALQAKLKEALSAQPAAVSATELAKAQQIIKEMTKENELLKARPAPNASQAELEAYVQKFAAERARAQQLADENKELKSKLSSSGVTDTAAVAALRVENEKLKNQLQAFDSASSKLPNFDRLVSELRDARARIAQLELEAAITGVEKQTLEGRVTNLNTKVATLNTTVSSLNTTVAALNTRNAALTKELDEMRKANYDARIRDLNEQKADLERKLNELQKNPPAVVTKKDDTSEQLKKLNAEVNALKSRLNVAEAKAVPYSAEELALFRQAPPKRLDVEPIKKSINELPAGTSQLVASAQDHFARHEFTEAESDYGKILEKDPNNGLVLANLATIELQEDKLDDAEKHIKAALAQAPNDAYNLSTLGYLKFRQEKFDEALDSLSKAADLDPNNPEIQNYLGVTLSHKGQRAQGETALRKALQLNPNYAPAHNNLAVMYLSQEPAYPLLARMHYQKALDAGQPHNPDLEKMLADKGAPLEDAPRAPGGTAQAQ
jgi:Tfp pilus assembly protein PilF/predicted  nucleic acid-binding Zn-ribbon protein